MFLLRRLTETLSTWAGQTELPIKFEGHGRSERLETINLNRTIGWFTTHYPLTIPRFSGSAAKRIRYTLNQLRQVPDGGLGFGVLRAVHPDPAVREQLAVQPDPAVVYNYLGQLGSSLDNHRFTLAKESAGPTASSDVIRPNLIDINAMITNGELHIYWTVTPQIKRKTADTLLKRFIDQINHLISEALSETEHIPIPSDYTDANLSVTQLESLLATAETDQTTIDISDDDEEI